MSTFILIFGAWLLFAMIVMSYIEGR